MAAKGRQHPKRDRNMSHNEDCKESSMISLLRVVKKYYPYLFHMLRSAEDSDTRNQSYVIYSMSIVLITLFFKNVLSLSSMRAMTAEFEDSTLIANIQYLAHDYNSSYLPHFATINNVLSALPPAYLEQVRFRIIRSLIHSKRFYDYRVKFGPVLYWVVAVDGTEVYSGSKKINEHCLHKTHNRGQESESTSYSYGVLEAKLVIFGRHTVFSLCTEPIENNGADAQRQKKMGAEAIKQDCEIKAFKRLAKKMHDQYPKLPILLVMDALYVAEPIIRICDQYGWKYCIRFKDGTVPYVEKEYRRNQDSHEKGAIANKHLFRFVSITFCNHIDFGNGNASIDAKEIIYVNFIEAWAKVKNDHGVEEVVKYQWITNLTITKDNAELLANVGRYRWRIEIEGFERQKRYTNNIEHVNCWNANAMMNHYLMAQISEIFLQLVEFEEEIELEKKLSGPKAAEAEEKREDVDEQTYALRAELYRYCIKTVLLRDYEELSVLPATTRADDRIAAG